MKSLKREYNDVLKQNAILEQKTELINLQLTECHERAENYKQCYDNLLSKLNDFSSSNDHVRKSIIYQSYCAGDV